MRLDNLKKIYTINIMSNEDYHRQVNEYFNNLRSCDIKHKHHEGECCYVGSVGERWAKYQEIEKIGRLRLREIEKTKLEILQLPSLKLVRQNAYENTIKRSKPIYIDKCNLDTITEDLSQSRLF
jgi:hypothetical protein